MSSPRPKPTRSRPAPVPPVTGRSATTSGPPLSGSRRTVIGAVVGAIVLAAVVAAVVLLGGRAGQPSTGGQQPATVAHVHGLGIDPADGALYAGTHYGVFRLPEGEPATRVADRVQDFMGFTVAGPDHYLASGHPGEGQGGPSSLGLIESTDGGQTWESLSLAGEADFHSLEARHGRVYGLNSLTGELMVSQDKATWETRSELPMADFAVSPEEPDVIVATTEQGLVRSADGGRSFEPLAGAPVSLLASWAQDGTLVAAEPDGTLHASTDGGTSWQARGNVGGAPHALTASSDDDIYAAIDGAIVVSSDGGRTFTTRYEE